MPTLIHLDPHLSSQTVRDHAPTQTCLATPSFMRSLWLSVPYQKWSVPPHRCYNLLLLSPLLCPLGLTLTLSLQTTPCHPVTLSPHHHNTSILRCPTALSLYHPHPLDLTLTLPRPHPRPRHVLDLVSTSTSPHLHPRPHLAHVPSLISVYP